MYVAGTALIVVVFLLMKFGFIVLDRNVFEFQISHIESRGGIENLREYRAVQGFVEQEFEIDPNKFESSRRIESLNKMLADFRGGM